MGSAGRPGDHPRCRDGCREPGDVVRIRGDHQGAPAASAKGHDVRVREIGRAGPGAVQHRADLAGQHEVGVDNHDRRTLTAARAVAREGGLDAAGPGRSTAHLSAHDRGHQHGPTAVEGLAQGRAERTGGRRVREGVEPVSVQHDGQRHAVRRTSVRPSSSSKAARAALPRSKTLPRTLTLQPKAEHDAMVAARSRSGGSAGSAPQQAWAPDARASPTARSMAAHRCCTAWNDPIDVMRIAIGYFTTLPEAERLKDPVRVVLFSGDTSGIDRDASEQAYVAALRERLQNEFPEAQAVEITCLDAEPPGLPATQVSLTRTDASRVRLATEWVDALARLTWAQVRWIAPRDFLT